MSSSGGVTHSASFAAYSYLTLALPLEMRHEGHNVSNPNISYSDFVSKIESGQVVNANNATTTLPPQVLTDFRVIEGLNQVQGAAEYALVQKAYALGMVDPSTGLLSSTIDTQQ